jgi:ankyrin repeat protein
VKRELQEVFKFYEREYSLNITDFIEDINHLGPFDALLHMAVRISKLEHIKILVESGADINVKDAMNFTPLHEAAYYGNAKTAELLLALGASTDMKNEFGDTPLDLALRKEKENANRHKRRKRASVSDVLRVN